MYDYVRRQQESQPTSKFSTKTFRWMDSGNVSNRSWVKTYAKDGPTDPLAYSSYSLFTSPAMTATAAASGPPRKSSVLQRSAASLAPHLTLRSLRRHHHHNNNQPATAFSLRRRGFTAPPNASHPSISQLESAITDDRNIQSSTVALAAIDNHTADFEPITQLHSSQVAFVGPDRKDHLHNMHVPEQLSFPEKRNDSSLFTFAPPPRPPNTFASLRPPPPQLQSSFSPPLSPHATRTFCSRARSLVHKVRTLTQQYHHHHHHHHNHHHSGYSSGVMSSPVIISSPPLPTQQRTEQRMGVVTSKEHTQPAASSTISAPRSHRTGGGGSTPKAIPGRLQQQRVLPRSPLATHMTLADVPSSPDSDDPQASIRKPSTSGSLSLSLSLSSSSSSSDEDPVWCQSCRRYKGVDWVVECEQHHDLCFGCVQNHVKMLLLKNPLLHTVICPLTPCQSRIASSYLRACLPPQRIQKLMENQMKRRKHSLQRSVSLCCGQPSTVDTTAASAVSPASIGSIPDAHDEEGFDEPIIVETPKLSIDSCSFSFEDVGQQLTRSIANLHTEGDSEDGSGQQPSSNSSSDSGRRKRYSASTPSLPLPHIESSSHPTGPIEKPSASRMFSELTSIEPGSMDSVVLAASVAADSSLTLSPESVGSKLRRVPRAQDNINANTQLPVPRVRIPSASFANDGGDFSFQPSPNILHNNNALQFSCPEIDMDFGGSGGGSNSLVPPSWKQLGGSRSKTAVADSKHETSPGKRKSMRKSSSAWTIISPDQQDVGYLEDVMLSARLFETIRRLPTTSMGDGSYNDDDSSDCSSPRLPFYTAPPAQHLQQEHPLHHRPPLPDMPRPNTTANFGDNSDGVFIPSWRRPDTTGKPVDPSSSPLWSNSPESAGILCEDAAVTFELYRTLRRQR